MENIKIDKDKNDTLSKEANDLINAAIKGFEEREARGEIEWITWEEAKAALDKI